MSKIVHIETLGCRLNQIESESAARCFSDAGFDVDMNPLTASAVYTEKPVLCIINTCTVTGKAEQKARRIIRLLLKKFPDSIILATGCYAQMEQSELEQIDSRVIVLPGMRKDLLAEIPLVFTRYWKNHDTRTGNVSLSDTIKTFIAEQNVPDDKVSADQAFKLSTDIFQFHSRSSVKIQDGCNNACTFCRIHLARGKSVSLDVKSVLDRVCELEKAGQHEVVITTVNIAQYRGEYNGAYLDFVDLLKFLLEHTNVIRFRMSSLYPELVDKRFSDIVGNPRIQPSFHLSVQSGSDRILERMNRKYSSECVRQAVTQLHTASDNPFISCDIIVGFPGETDEDFEKTMKLCRDCNFAWIHAFPFSPRPGTPAYTMRPRVANNIVKDRVAKLTEFAQQSKIDYINSCRGKVFEAITETTHTRDGRSVCCNVHNDSPAGKTLKIHAVTSNFIHAEIPYREDQKIPSPGSLILIRIKNALPDKIRSGDEIEAEADIVK